MAKHLSIPEARDKLRELAVTHGLPELSELASQLYRRSPKYRKARASRRSLTPALAEQIRTYKSQHPQMSNRDIGEKFGVDGGRVSEAIHHQEPKATT